jgi:hypothetical protein
MKVHLIVLHQQINECKAIPLIVAILWRVFLLPNLIRTMATSEEFINPGPLKNDKDPPREMAKTERSSRESPPTTSLATRLTYSPLSTSLE